MAKWYEKAFGAVADEVGAAISDVRTKLIDEAWFGRMGVKPPAPEQTPASDPAADRDRLIDFGHFGSGDVSPIGRNPDAENYRWIDPPTPKQAPAPPEPSPEQDHGIDR